MKNRYVGRTFIQPNQKQRGQGVRLKLNPLPENIRGKKLVVVDDSIVRGTTTRQVVQMLREAGAAEVHFRVSSPPYKWPCFYGMDTGRRSELLAADMSVGEIRDFLGVDSLAYLELDRLTTATGASSDSFCTACLSGDYPVPVPLDRLEARARGRRRRPAPPRRLDDGGAAATPPTPLTYAGAGVDIAAGERAVELIKQHVRSTFRPEVVGDIGGFGGLFAFDPRRFAHPLLVSSTDGVGTKSLIARLTGRYDTIGIDLRRDVGRRHRGAGRRAAVLPRLHLDRQARPRDRRRHRRRRRRRMRAGRLRAARRRDVGAPRPHGAGRVRPRRVRGRRRRARAGPARGRAGRATSIIGIASPGLRCNGYSLARKALLDRAGRRARRSRVEGRAPLPRRRAAPPERDLRARDARSCASASRSTRSRTSPAAASPTTSPASSRRTATPCCAVGTWEEPRIFAEIQAAGDVPDDEMEHVFNLGLGMLAVVAPEDRLRLRSTPYAPQVTRRGSSERCQKAAVG